MPERVQRAEEWVLARPTGVKRADSINIRIPIEESRDRLIAGEIAWSRVMYSNQVSPTPLWTWSGGPPPLVFGWVRCPSENESDAHPKNRMNQVPTRVPH
jgi:hypothetical protein